MSLKRDEAGVRMPEPVQIPLPRSTQGILDIIRKVLSKPYVLSISLRAGKPIEVVWERAISEYLDLEGPTGETPDQVLSRIELEEFDSSSDPRAALLDAILLANQSGLHVSHLFGGSIKFIKDWLGIPRVVQLPKFEGTDYYNLFGLKLLEVTSLPEESVVLMAAEVQNPEMEELVKGYRITA